MKQTPTILPRMQRILEQLGTNIKLARLRRDLTTTQIAERSGVSRTTLWLIEKGDKGVSIAAYIQVLLALGLEQNLLKFGQDDVLGRDLQDMRLLGMRK